MAIANMIDGSDAEVFAKRPNIDWRIAIRASSS